MKSFSIKKLIALTVCLLAGVALYGQQPNDDCSAAFPVSSGQTVAGSTVGATLDSLGTCGTSITAPGVWYFIVGNGGSLTASTCNQAAYDTKISIFSGSCGALTCEGGNDDGPGCSGFTSETSVLTQPGVIYYILVHGFSSNTGNFDLTVALGAPPSGNDVCGGALPVACGQTVTGSTAQATADNAPFCGTSNSAPGVWYQFVGTGGPVVASLCNGTTYDSKLTVYSGSCGALTCIDGNDDACGTQSEVQFASTAGQTYYILVHGFGSATGNFSLELTCIVPPTNDDPCSAQALAFGNNDYAHIGLTADSTEVNPGAGSGASSCNSTDGWCSFELDVDNTSWWTFVAPAGGSVNIVADGFDSQIAVYSASDCNDYGTFVEVGANDDSGDDIIAGSNTLSGGLTLNCLTPGETYYVQVDGYNGAETNTASVVLEDNGGSLPSVDAGDCQSTYLGYAPVANDTNFLYASASGVGPFTITWSVVSGDSTTLFEDQIDDSTLVLVVQPNQTTVYEATVTDARGCTATDQVTVEQVNVACFNGVQMCYSPANAGQTVVLDWDTDGLGNALPAGTPITNQYANLGINISADNNNGPDDAVIFNSSAPTGGDYDLGTPNQDFGGPGHGNGGRMGMPGANSTALGNILIIQERSQMCGGVYCTPDDDADGGVVTFTFDDPYTVETIVIVDADDGNPSGAVVTIDANTGSYTLNFPSLGDNSVITLPIFEDGVLSMDISFQGSGAIGAVNLKREQVTFCAATADVAGLLNQGDYNLGTCSDDCIASNPSVTPPPSCVDLVVGVTTDNFANETSWEVVERGSGQVIASRQFGFADDGLTFADTICVDPRNCYDVTIFDSFGDGICCGTFGNGTWSVTYDGNTTVSPSGGQYAADETISVGSCNNKGAAPAESVLTDPTLKAVAYPNPTTSDLSIKYSTAVDGVCQIGIYNLQGTQIVAPYSVDAPAGITGTAEFDLSGLPAGVYLYRVINGNHVETGKIQVVR